MIVRVFINDKYTNAPFKKFSANIYYVFFILYMVSIEQLQLSNFQAFLPLILSEDDRKTEKTITMTLEMDIHLSKACLTDSLSRTLDLGECSRRIRSYCSGISHPMHVTDFSRSIIGVVDTLAESTHSMKLVVELPGCNSFSKEVTYKIRRNGTELVETLTVGNIHIRAFLGCTDTERCQPQVVILEVELEYPKIAQNHLPKVNTQSLILSIIQSVEKATYNTMECLASGVVDFIGERYCFTEVRVFLQKPHAISGAFSSGVRIGRTTAQSGLLNYQYIYATDAFHANTAYLSLGSNIEDRLSNIHQALDLLKKEKEVAIVDTSFLYLSEYQGALRVKGMGFLNAAVKVRTSHGPQELLALVKKIEYSIGRAKIEENDDRNIDLDIIFYNNLVVDSGNLTMPHPRMHLREWVLRPLLDIDPFFIHPCYNTSVACLLESYLRKADHRIPMGLAPEDMPCLNVERVIQLGRSLHKWDVPGRSLIMGILNVTPDSFSDGGSNLDPKDAEKRFFEMVEQGADVIDIGGVSTRPGADEVEVSEEYSRVIPVLEAVRKVNKDVVISIDTTTPEIAGECLKRGADLINTTVCTNKTQEMYKLIASSNIPIVIMHSRGTPKTMISFITDHRRSELLEEVSRETNAILAEARRLGIYKWNIILDPGIGFAKTPVQNLDMISEYHRYHPFSSYPCLVGHSRKSFIQKLGLAAVGSASCSHPITLWGTLAATSILCHNQTFIIRVHDVPENSYVAKLHDLANVNTSNLQSHISAGKGPISSKETR